MRVLPILWEVDPTQSDWGGLSAAREALGYREKIMPANAVPGSPQPVLCVNTTPSWLTDYATTDTTNGCEEALAYCLSDEEHDTLDLYAGLLSKWMGCDVIAHGVEELEEDSDRFV